MADEIRVRVQGKELALWVRESAVIRECEVTNTYLTKCTRPKYRKGLPSSLAKVAENHEYYLGDNGKAWRYGYKDGAFWYSYDNIPDRSPACYRSRLPQKSELIKLAGNGGNDGFENITLKVKRLVSSEDRDFFVLRKHPASGKSMINVYEADSMAEGVAWVLFIKEAIADKSYLEYGVKQVAEFYEVCAEIISKRKIGSIKRSSGRSLRNRITTLPDSREEVRLSLISGKYCNDNAAIIGKKTVLIDEITGECVEVALHDTIFLALWMNFGSAGKHTKVNLYKKYCTDMIDMKLRPLSLSSFSSYLNREDIKFLTARERHGKEYFKKMLQTYVPSRRLEYANSLWCGDASGTINYGYVGRDGKVRSRKLYTVLISDVASGYIAGWAVGKSDESSENAVMIRKATSMALLNPLNEGREVLEFVSDNHGAYSSDGAKKYLKRVARVVRRIEAHNSQGNPAERLFKVFKQSLRGLYNMSNTSFGAKSVENLANPDYMDNDLLPTYEEAIKQLEGLIDEFNNRILADGSTPAERFKSSKNPECGVYREEAFRFITADSHVVDISSKRGFVEICSNYEKTRYEIPTDVETLSQLVKYVGVKQYKPVTVYADGEKADIYTMEGVYMMSVNKAKEACMSAYEASEEELTARQYHDNRKAQQMQDVDDFESDILENIELLSQSFEINMAGGGYGSSPKKRYNEEQEKAHDLAVKSKAKIERRAKREAGKTREQNLDDYVNKLKQRSKERAVNMRNNN